MEYIDDNYFLQTAYKEKRFGIFYDAGKGKTAMTLSLIDFKIKFCNIKSILIIAPKKVTLGTWQAEMKKWDNFNYMYEYTELLDGDENTRIKKVKNSNTFIHIVSSSLTEWLDSKEKRVGKRIVREKNPHVPKYDLVIVDEVSQFKDTTTNRYKALKRLTSDCELFILSGTPFPNMSLVGKQYKKADELYYVFYLLGIYTKSLTNFRNEFCFQKNYDKYNYYMLEETYISLNNILNDYCVRAKNILNVELKIHKIYCELEVDVFKKLKKDYLIKTDNFEKINASNKAIMIDKSLQLANGFMYDVNKKAIRFNRYKFDKMLDVINMFLLDENIIIFYFYEEDKNFILDNLPNSRVYHDEKDEQDWNAGLIKYMLLNPKSGKFGLNLQFGGHTGICFGLRWSGEDFEQQIKRLYRRGQMFDVDIFCFLAENSFDDYVYDVVVAKTKSIDDFQTYF